MAKQQPHHEEAKKEVKKHEEKKQELATPNTNTGLVTSDIASLLLEDEGAGRETMSAKDLAIPRLAILQALSPTCTKGDPAYIKEAEVGEIIDNISGKRWAGEEGIIVIPVSYRRAYIEWDNRKFVADHGTDDTLYNQCVKNEKKQMQLPNGHTMVETAEYYCVMLEPETGLPRQVVISMSRTMFSEAKRWNSLMSNLMVPRPDGEGVFNPAIFYHSYKLTTIPKSNDDGTWYVWKVNPYKPTLELVGGHDLYLGSRSFRKAVVSGSVKVADHDAAAIIDPAGSIEGEI
jgi:hypothetical protein